MNHVEREALLDDLFSEYDDYDDYDRDPEEIVAQLCGDLGLVAVDSMSQASRAQLAWEREEARSAAASANSGKYRNGSAHSGNGASGFGRGRGPP